MATSSLTFVVTCKGRLRYLRQTLPLLAAQQSAACVVVDYGCPDHSGDWIEANLPQVTVVRWPDTGRFNAAHARNLGVAAATSEAVCLIDSDVLVTPEFVPTILGQFDPRCYYLAEPLDGDTTGTIVCGRTAFDFAGGYDETFTGWGGEDLDLYARLDFHGLRRLGFPARLLSALPHPDSERTTFHAESDKELTNSINLIYSHVKLDLMRMAGSRVPAPYCATLYAQVRDACLESDRARALVRLEIPFAEGAVNRCTLQSSVVYMLDVSRRPGKGEPTAPMIAPFRTSGGGKL